MTESLYLGVSKEGKQIGLFKTSDQAFGNPKVHVAEIWSLNEKTGQFHPTIGSIARLEILPRKEDVKID